MLFAQPVYSTKLNIDMVRHWKKLGGAKRGEVGRPVGYPKRCVEKNNSQLIQRLFFSLRIAII
jgi:hypothetical protein